MKDKENKEEHTREKMLGERKLEMCGSVSECVSAVHRTEAILGTYFFGESILGTYRNKQYF